MKFNVLTEMEYTAQSAGTIILNIHALRTSHQTIINETLTIVPYIKVEEFISAQNENRLIRFEIPGASAIKVIYKAAIDNFCEIKDYSEIQEIPVAKMDTAA
ncbi:MAG TPA: transglutaminase family protein, partial [Mucilaginibacter sp.]